MSEYNKVCRNAFDGNNLLGWGWELPIILFGQAGEGHRQEEAMLVMAGDGDRFRPCRDHHTLPARPVLPDRSASGRDCCRISNTGRTVDIIRSCQDKHFS